MYFAAARNIKKYAEILVNQIWGFPSQFNQINQGVTGNTTLTTLFWDTELSKLSMKLEHQIVV